MNEPIDQQIQLKPVQTSESVPIPTLRARLENFVSRVREKVKTHKNGVVIALIVGVAALILMSIALVLMSRQSPMEEKKKTTAPEIKNIQPTLKDKIRELRLILIDFNLEDISLEPPQVDLDVKF